MEIRVINQCYEPFFLYLLKVPAGNSQHGCTSVNHRKCLVFLEWFDYFITRAYEANTKWPVICVHNVELNKFIHELWGIVASKCNVRLILVLIKKPAIAEVKAENSFWSWPIWKQVNNELTHPAISCSDRLTYFWRHSKNTISDRSQSNLLSYGHKLVIIYADVFFFLFILNYFIVFSWILLLYLIETNKVTEINAVQLGATVWLMPNFIIIEYWILRFSRIVQLPLACVT